MKFLRGQSVVEILLAIAVGAILVIAGAAVIAPAFNTNKNVSKAQAVGAATKELADNVRVWADQDWHAVMSLATGTSNTYYINSNQSPLAVVPGTESIQIQGQTITRFFYVTDAYRDATGKPTSTVTGTTYDPSTKQITIVVIPPASTTAATTPLSFVAFTLANNLGVSGTGSSVTTAATTTTVGTFAVACVTTGGTFNTPAISDSKGNTWTQAGAENSTPSGARVRMYYAQLTAAGSGHTFSVNNSGSADSGIAVGIWNGVAVSSPLDTAGGSNGTGVSPSSGTLTPAASGDILVGCVTHNNGGSVTSAGSGFTLVYTNDNTSSAQPVGEEYEVLNGTPATSSIWSFTSSNPWAVIGGMFRWN